MPMSHCNTQTYKSEADNILQDNITALAENMTLEQIFLMI